MRPGFRLPAAALSAALLVGVLAIALGSRQAPTLAQTAPTPTPGAASAAPPSSEELLLSILPYRLQTADLPAGFHVLDHNSVTPAKRAFDIGDTDAASQDALKSLQRGGLLSGFEQVLGPNNNTPVRVALFDVELYAADLKASAAFHKGLDVTETSRIQSDNPPLPIRLGDESGAVHVISTSSAGFNTAFEAISWRRKSVVFTMIVIVYDSTDTLDQALPFAQSADRRAVTVAALAPAPQAALPVVSSDSYQIDAMYALYGRLPAPEQVPIGFRPEGRSVIDNSDLLLDADNPRAEFDRLSGRWKRVAEVERSYATLQGGGGDLLHVRLALSADGAGATANVLEPLHESGSAVETFSLPRPLGDTSRIYHETYTRADGVPRETWRAMWTRGRVVLTVYSTGPAGDFSAQQIADFAALVDATFQKGALPDVLTTATPGPPAPAALPEQ